MTIEFELRQYLNQNIPVNIDGKDITQEELCLACTVLESSSYMRDFVQEESGEITAVNFNRISGKINNQVTGKYK